MKKKFNRPDGTVVEIEGTAEELAEYERQMNESGTQRATKPISASTSKKTVLKG